MNRIFLKTKYENSKINKDLSIITYTKEKLLLFSWRKDDQIYKSYHLRLDAGQQVNPIQNINLIHFYLPNLVAGLFFWQTFDYIQIIEQTVLVVDLAPRDLDYVKIT